MFKKFLSVLVISLMFVPGFAKADDLVLPPVPDLSLDEPTVGEAISPMKLGQKAPFTGILFSPDAVAKIVTEINSIPEQIKIHTEKTQKLCTAKCELDLNDLRISWETEQKISAAELSAVVSQNLVLVNRIKSLESSQSNTIWWVGGGVLVGAGITVLAVFVTSGN